MNPRSKYLIFVFLASATVSSLFFTSQLQATQYTNEQLITGLTRAGKANDSAAIDKIGQILDMQSHSCAVRLGTLARLAQDDGGRLQEQTKEYASASAEICDVGPSTIFYYLEFLNDTYRANMIEQSSSSGGVSWAYYAEQYARLRGCNVDSGGAILVESRSDGEIFKVPCVGAESVLVQCHNGECRGLL